MPRAPNSSRQTRAVFAVLAEAPRTWRHGYDIARATGLKSGTLYPLLARLSDQGLLDSRWEPPAVMGRPPRHAYRLTAQGLALAQSLAVAEPSSPQSPGRKVR